MFVFGRDENTCDIRLLGDRYDGISKRHWGPGPVLPSSAQNHGERFLSTVPQSGLEATARRASPLLNYGTTRLVADLGIEFGEGPVDPELRRYNSPADLFNPLTSGSAAREAIDWRWRHSGQHTQFNTVQVAEAERIFPATKENAYITTGARKPKRICDGPGR
ncbi:hypothetical protein M0657_011217 [Pyricularia oryzae]|nr:hypothetical protein M0657_011217 [Pyricularia oryzae]